MRRSYLLGRSCRGAPEDAAGPGGGHEGGFVKPLVRGLAQRAMVFRFCTTWKLAGAYSDAGDYSMCWLEGV